MRGSTNSQVGYIWQQLDGIGQSKFYSREASTLTSLDGARLVSPLVHSYQYKDEVVRTALDLGQFARENFGEKNYEKIDGRMVESWILNKIESGVSRGTLENYISHLGKVGYALGKISTSHDREYTAFSRADLLSVRETVSDLSMAAHENRAYENPGAVISNLSGNEYIAGRLQLEHGLRVTEATRIAESQLQGNTLTFNGKGGHEQTKVLPVDLAQGIRDGMKNGRFSVNPNAYRNSLRESCRIEGEKYAGSHGLRYNFAQKLFVREFDKNLECGMSHQAAENTARSHVSREMGHHREEITTHYL